jgi:hypothetical protein
VITSNSSSSRSSSSSSRSNKTLFQRSSILLVQVAVADISIFPASASGPFSATYKDFAENSAY